MWWDNSKSAFQGLSKANTHFWSPALCWHSDGACWFSLPIAFLPHIPVCILYNIYMELLTCFLFWNFVLWNKFLLCYCLHLGSGSMKNQSKISDLSLQNSWTELKIECIVSFKTAKCQVLHTCTCLPLPHHFRSYHQQLDSSSLSVSAYCIVDKI